MTHYLKNLSGTTQWDRNSSGGKVAITKKVTVSGTTSQSISAKLGLALPTQVGKVSAELGGNTSVSVTYTKANSVLHERALDRNSKEGYYALYAQMDSDLYKANVFTLKKGNYTYKGTGYLVKFRASEPYVALRYSSSQF